MKLSELQGKLSMNKIVIKLYYLRTTVIPSCDITTHFTIHGSGGVKHFVY